jgi:hypothetical protein
MFGMALHGTAWVTLWDQLDHRALLELLVLREIQVQQVPLGHKALLAIQVQQVLLDHRAFKAQLDHRVFKV